MNLLDKAISWFNPEKAFTRQQYRRALEMGLSYDAARRDRSTGDWATPSTDGNAEIYAALPAVRDRTRDLIRNNPYAKKAVIELVGAQIGTGMMPRASTGKKSLDKKINAAFKEWQTQCDADGQLDFSGIQYLVARAIPESGEALVRFRTRRPEDGIKVPLQLQVLESDRIDSTKNESMSYGYIKQGIEFDVIGKPKAVWLYEQHPGGNNVWQGTFTSKPVAYEDICHVYLRERPETVRGMPWFAPLVGTLRNLDVLEEALLVRAQMEACIGMVVTQPQGTTGGPLGRAITGQVGNAQATVEEFRPGMIPYLRPGENVSALDPKPSTGQDALAKRLLRKAACGMSMPYELLSGDMSDANYSTYRAGQLSFRNNVEIFRWVVYVPMFLAKFWRRWIDTAFQAGVIPEANYGVKWTCPKMESVDPLKDIQAAKERVRGGATAWPEMVAEHGFDPQEQIEEIKQYNDLFDANGIILDIDPRKTDWRGAGITPSAPSPAPAPPKA